MGEKTKIEWTDATWNPITGCTKISEGCKNCYAERIAKRFWGDRKFSDIRYHPCREDQPLHWRKPRKIFVCSMGDLFHEDLVDWMPAEVFEIIKSTPQHTYIILTKRIEYANKYLPGDWGNGYPNIWLGVTAENQQRADERIPILLKTPAAVRFVSVEPMLESVGIYQYLGGNREIKSPHKYNGGINWVICGCESGTGARPFDWHWAQDLKNQCVNAGVPFFYKQGRYSDNELIKTPLLDGRQWIEYPEERNEKEI